MVHAKVTARTRQLRQLTTTSIVRGAEQDMDFRNLTTYLFTIRSETDSIIQRSLNSLPFYQSRSKQNRSLYQLQDILEAQTQALRKALCQVRELKIAIHARDNLLAIVSHDIRNALTSIRI